MKRAFGAQAERKRIAQLIRAGSECRRELMVGFAVVVTLVSATGAFGSMHFEDPSLRGAIEIAIAMWALVAATLLYGNFKRTRSRRDLLLMAALSAAGLTDFVFSAVPALADAPVLAGGPGATLASSALVALCFAAAAGAGDGQIRGNLTKIGAAATAAAILIVVTGWLLDVPAGASIASAGNHVGGGSAGAHPLRMTVTIVSSALLLLAGMAFLFRARRGFRDGWLLAVAAYLLAAARLQYLVLPTVLVDSVTVREGLRVVAYALLLAAAARQYAAARRADAEEALAAERERLARDLHDGIAQDLAFIALHSQRLDGGGEDNPVTLAARRALAASRGAIVDLSASHAPSTISALRGVADEIEGRFGVQVRVAVRPAESEADGLAPHDREHVVRIAREAMMNAVRHGGATHLDVVLDPKGRTPLLRVLDDGSGIETGVERKLNGFGTRMMEARARSLGGEVVRRRRAEGGTELELVLS